jgi:uncharacterized protein
MALIEVRIMAKTLSQYDRAEFRNILDQFVHPSENVFLPRQLKGRQSSLRDLRDCFETGGSQAFIWGPRGVGKTSLAHTSCEEHRDVVTLVSAVACEQETTVNSLMADVVREVVQRGKVDVTRKDLAAKLSLLGLEIAGKLVDPASIKIESVNHSVDLLSSICAVPIAQGLRPVIIVDEFERLGSADVKRHFTDLVKQLSAKGVPIKFVFCGVATSLTDLLGQHASAERYVQQIELRPLIPGALLDIVSDVESQFNVRFSRGQRMRIAQISDGYAHFTHLILKNVLLVCFEGQLDHHDIPDHFYREGINRSVSQVADRLKRKFEAATQKGTDVFIEVLWAVAHGPHLRKQFKIIQSDYNSIMETRPDRERLEDQKLRNSLNSLTKKSHGAVLHRHAVGWYEFEDPMLRGYCRLRAEQIGLELGDHNFKN